MDTTLALPPKSAATVVYMPEQLRIQDTKVPVVKELDRSATLPSDKVFVAQVVNARLSGTEFPENPGEIAPPERTLRPYSVPMLPFDKDESDIELIEENAVDDVATKDDAPAKPDQKVAAIEDDTLQTAAATVERPNTSDQAPLEEPAIQSETQNT